MRAISLLKNRKKNYETVSLKNIRKGSPFVNLFPIKPEVLKAISEDMKVNGFDQSQPVIIWKETELLIDGHTRFAGAVKAGLNYVYAVYESFPDVDSALRYAYGLQFKRRNLTDADRFHFSETYMNNVGHEAKKSGWKKKELAEILSVSTGTAQKYISVLSRGSKKDKEDVINGFKTINSVYKSLLDRENNNKKKVSTPIKKSTPKTGKTDNAKPVVDVEVIRAQLDRWAEERNHLRAYLYPNREKIKGIIEILPDGSEIRNYALSLVDEGSLKKESS